MSIVYVVRCGACDSLYARARLLLSTKYTMVWSYQCYVHTYCVHHQMSARFPCQDRRGLWMRLGMCCLLVVACKYSQCAGSSRTDTPRTQLRIARTKKLMPLKPSQALSKVGKLLTVASSWDEEVSEFPQVESKPGQQQLERIIIDALATIDSQVSPFLFLLCRRSFSVVLSLCFWCLVCFLVARSSSLLRESPYKCSAATCV